MNSNKVYLKIATNQLIRPPDLIAFPAIAGNGLKFISRSTSYLNFISTIARQVLVCAFRLLFTS